MNNYFNWNIKKSEESVDISVQNSSVEEPIDNSVVEGLTSIIIPAALLSVPLFHYTGNCIGSIREHTTLPYEIILVLNGKSVIEFDDYSKTYCDKVIPLEENEGYAKAVNKGIRASRGEYIAIINNDVQVYTEWLEGLRSALEKGYDLSMACPMYGMPWARATESKKILSKYDGTGVTEIENIFSDRQDFSCVLTKRSVFDEIGLFNEEFFAYGEDSDFLRRMREKGLKYTMVNAVATTHMIGATSYESGGQIDAAKIMNESKEKYKKIWEK